MIRRQFIQLMTLAGAGAGSLAALEKLKAHATETVTYRVKGFSCITCAVGLDAMLREQKGIARSQSSYPDGIVKIEFDPTVVTGQSLRAFISSMGFTVENEGKGQNPA